MIRHALQLLQVAKDRNISTDQELSGQLRWIAGEKSSPAEANQRHDENEGSVRMAASERHLHTFHSDGRTSSRHVRPQHDSEQTPGSKAMYSLRFTEQFKSLFSLAVEMTTTAGADAIILLLDGPADW